MEEEKVEQDLSGLPRQLRLFTLLPKEHPAFCCLSTDILGLHRPSHQVEAASFFDLMEHHTNSGDSTLMSRLGPPGTELSARLRSPWVPPSLRGAGWSRWPHKGLLTARGLGCSAGLKRRTQGSRTLRQDRGLRCCKFTATGTCWVATPHQSPRAGELLRAEEPLGWRLPGRRRATRHRRQGGPRGAARGSPNPTGAICSEEIPGSAPFPVRA
ncbi:uncharacterized protein isoform X2 [Castor canadensis]|uniref:Uncharacterized protein isoform X2 n=1 Tax=Castor canadensis TaxID=51338 RepID=A0AC58LVU8_CASCN